MEQTVFDFTMATGASNHVVAWYAENPKDDPENDAAIGYAVFDPKNKTEIARGVMKYDSAKTVYDQIRDVKSDLRSYLAGVLNQEILLADDTRIDPSEYI